MKQWLLAVVGAFVVIVAGDFVIHNLWLMKAYEAHPEWWRPAQEMQSLLPFMVAGQALLAALLTMVYGKGVERGKSGLGQGLRFGILMGLLLWAPASLMMVAIYPYPSSLIVSWFVGGVIELTLAGAVIGLLYKPAS
jgi:hypothetical protein